MLRMTEVVKNLLIINLIQSMSTRRLLFTRSIIFLYLHLFFENLVLYLIFLNYFPFNYPANILIRLF